MTARNGRGPGLAVVKVGGDLLEDAGAQLGANLCAMRDAGWRLVVVHGGGPQVSRLQKRLGLGVAQVGGRRITGPDDLLAVQQALVGEVNSTLVAALVRDGLAAFGCHGASATLLRARKRPPMRITGHPQPVDFGAVGDVVAVNSDAICGLLDMGLVPVIATLGLDPEHGALYNINADTSAVAVARALAADWLLLVGISGGVWRNPEDPASRIKRLGSDEARQLVAAGAIRAGMQVKVEEALALAGQGTVQVAALAADAPDALLCAVSGRNFPGTIFGDN